jgi:ATP-binding protein involved in chromosome partitioning
MVTNDQILRELRKIIDPDFKRDIVSLGFIENLKIQDGNVSFDIALTTPACPVKGEFQKTAQDLVSAIAGVQSVQVNMTVLKRAINQSFASPLVKNLEGVKTTIAVSSCKGGVGKSTLAAYMALELANRGFKVGLLDADIYGPSVPTLFNLKSYRVELNPAQKLTPAIKHNLKIMSFGFLLGDVPAIMRGPIVTRYVQQLLLNTAWGDLDYLFIDMPPGTGDVQLTITQTLRLNAAVIVTTPQSLSLVDVSRGMIMFEKVHVPILGIIENMSYFICDNCDKKHYVFGYQGAQILKDRFGVEILADLPLLPKLFDSTDQYTSNPAITQMVDRVVMALGKSLIMDHELPEIELDEKEFTLIWPDETKATVSYRDLRLSCQCALCVNEMSGKKMLNEKSVRPDIAPKEVYPLGNYALAITWNDGHSSGIYPYETIKKLSRLPAHTK